MGITKETMWGDLGKSVSHGLEYSETKNMMLKKKYFQENA